MKESGATLWEVMVVIVVAIFGVGALGLGVYLAWLIIQALQKYIAA